MSLIDIDLSTTPFSCRGSWMSFSCPSRLADQPLGPGLYLRTNHWRPLAQRELFLVTLRRSGRAVPARITATPDLLRLQPLEGPGLVEIVLTPDGTVRVRGEGIDLRFEAALRRRDDPANAAHFVAYQDGPERFTVNARPSMRRYQFAAVHGTLALDAPFEVEQSRHARVDAGPAADGRFELAIDEYGSTWTPRPRPSFDRVHERCRRDFAVFRDSLPPLPRRFAAARERAAYTLWSCTQAPAGQLRREAVFMSLNWMDQVWSWDNCFNAAALAAGQARLAMDQFLVVADHQDAHGAYPDGLNDGFKHYNFSKPPVQGILFDWIAAHSPAFWTPRRRRELYATTAAFTEWWLQHRRWPGEVLCHYLHGNDSGWDNSSLLREGAPLIAPDLNAFLVRQCRTLARLAHGSGRARVAARWSAQAEELQTALLAELWRGGQFVGLHLPSGRRAIDSQSLVSCMPIVLGRALPEAIRQATVRRIRGFVTAAGLATEHPDSPFYESDGYWRGPMWGPSTMLVCAGLADAGEEVLARRIARRYVTTCVRSGFAENFDALSGAPLRDRAYTWTASAFLELARRWA